MLIINNAFSISMLNRNSNVEFRKISLREAAIEIALKDEIINVIGHPSTDAIVRERLRKAGAEVPAGERRNVTLTPGDRLLVAQYRGPRLPEGATELPENATIEWWMVKIPSVKQLFVVDLELGEIHTYRFDESGRCIGGESPPFQREELALVYDPQPFLRIFEGSHWEYGDRDEDVPIPGITEDEHYFICNDYRTAAAIAAAVRGEI